MCATEIGQNAKDNWTTMVFVVLLNPKSIDLPSRKTDSRTLLRNSLLLSIPNSNFRSFVQLSRASLCGAR